MSPTRKRLLAAGAVMLAALVAIQFVPAARTNRVGAGDPAVSRELQWTLRRACYDCHSTESRWPIWAYVAPISWRVISDVERARRVLNFSDWAAYTPEQQRALRHTINWTTAAHRMPLWYYVTLHPDGRLSDADRRLLDAWARDTTK